MAARVLLVTKGLGRGGAERLLVGLARRLDRSRFDVEVAYQLPWKDALVDEFDALGVRTHCIGGGRAFDVRWLPTLRSLAAGFDLVHTHAPVPAVGARLVTPRRIPMVHTEHNTWDRYQRVTRLANRLTYGRNDAAIAVSQAVAASVRTARGDRPPPVEVVTYGADLDAERRPDREAARVTLGLDPAQRVVGTVGNLTPKKDHRTLVEAFAGVARDRADVRLVVVGTGPEQEQLLDLCRERGISDAVLFTGVRDDVADILAAFDVFVLSSLHEGLPIAMLEAMATGVPVVATRVGGIPEVISDGVDGLLVPPGDPTRLADAIVSVLDDPATRADLGSRGRRRAEHFDLADAVRKTEAIYARVLATSR